MNWEKFVEALSDDELRWLRATLGNEPVKHFKASGGTQGNRTAFVDLRANGWEEMFPKPEYLSWNHKDFPYGEIHWNLLDEPRWSPDPMTTS